MSDIHSFARDLAAQAKRKLDSEETRTKAQLHKRRVLDAELRPLWRSLIAALSEGIAAYDKGLSGTLLEQTREMREDGDQVHIRWRYPHPENLTVELQFERSLIVIAKAGAGGKAAMDLVVTIDDQDRPLIAKKGGAPVGDHTEAAQEIMKFMLSGSGL